VQGFWVAGVVVTTCDTAPVQFTQFLHDRRESA